MGDFFATLLGEGGSVEVLSFDDAAVFRGDLRGDAAACDFALAMTMDEGTERQT
jgi:hypothetical protein